MAPDPLHDVIANRTSISLARSQYLIDLWLPASSDLPNSKTEAEQDEEDARIFNAEPELLGLGRSVPKAEQNGGDHEGSAVKDEELRRRILGKRKRQDAGTAVKGHHAASKPRPAKVGGLKRDEGASGDEDEEGRTGLGKVRRVTKDTAQQALELEKADTVEGAKCEGLDGAVDEDTDELAGAGPPRPKTFLDEVLADHAHKRKRKKKKKKKKSEYNG